MMRILKLVKYRLKAQVEKDKSPNGEGRRPKWKRTKPQVKRRMKAQVEKDEGPEAETLSRLLIVAEGPS